MINKSLAEILAVLGSQPRLISDVEGIVESFVTNFDLRQARVFAKQLDQSISVLPLELQPRVRGLAVRLKILALPLYLNRDDILDPFRHGLGLALQYDEPNIIQRIRAKLIDFGMSERDQWRQDIAVALHENSDVITSSGPKSGNQVLRGTVGVWLANYDQVFTVDLVDNIKIADYLFHSKWTRDVSTPERVILGKLINIYEFLKLSSETALGFEEEYDFTDGRFVKDFNNGRPIVILDLVRGLRVSQSKTSIDDSPGVVVLNSASAVVSPHKLMPQVFKTSGPAFLFDEADEQEADAFRNPKSEILNSKNLEQGLRLVAEDTIKQHNFSFKDEISHKRFVQLFVSFLKDVRDVIEAREMLLKSTDNGGLGLTSEKTEKVIAILQQAKKEFELRINPEADTAVSVATGRGSQELRTEKEEEIIHYTHNDKTEQSNIAAKPKTELDKMIEAEASAGLSLGIQDKGSGIKTQESGMGMKEVTTLSKQSAKTEQPATTLEPILPSVPGEQVSTLASVKSKSPLTPEEAEDTRQWILQEIVNKIETDKVPAVSISPIKSQSLEHAAAPRQRLVDVKAPPRVLGPIEELRTLSIVDLRRLSDNPAEALQKLQKKIDIIGEASVGKKVEAIRAWQASPVYQKYLEVGRASIDSGQSVASIIAERTKAGEVTLNEEEFNAIVDFNERIRF